MNKNIKKYDYPFFTTEELEVLNESAGLKYNKEYEGMREAYNILKKAYTKVEYWAKAVQNILFSEGEVKVRKRPTNQGNHFEFYLWAKIYPIKTNGDNKWLAYTLSIEKNKGFLVKFDTIGVSKNTLKRRVYLKLVENYQNEKLIGILETPSNWNDLINQTVLFIKSIESDFQIFKKRFDTLFERPAMKKITPSLNKILYGPPGTGKTHKLQYKYFDKFTVSESSLTKEQYLENKVADLTWWQTFAVALQDLGLSGTAEILDHEVVKAKERQSSAKSIKPILWSRLQAHTVLDCPNVKVKTRSEPQLFFKNDSSKWRVEEALLKEAYPEALEILEKIKNYTPDVDKTIKNYEFVTFHQSFGYEDFVEGIKPKMEEQSTNLEYEIQDGVFKRLALKAKADPKNGYAIFIDEINRGNVSAIFGELITLIEKDKRLGEANELMVKLPYSRTLFGVPPNLYIIGTMNTADRSVEALDTALRRRFAFEEVMPQPYLLSPAYEYWRLLWEFKDVKWEDEEFKKKEELFFKTYEVKQEFIEARKDIWARIEKDGPKEQQVTLFEKFNYSGLRLDRILRTINKRIEALLDRDHTIGHSYFLKVKEAENKEEVLKQVFKDSIIPLLQEYFYGEYRKIGLVLGEGFVKLSEEKSEEKKEQKLFANFYKLENEVEVVPSFELIKIDENFQIIPALKKLLNHAEA